MFIYLFGNGNEYITGNKRFYIPDLEETITKGAITHDSILADLNATQNEYYISSHLTEKYFKTIYENYRTTEIPYDFNFQKLIYVIENKTLKGLIGISKIVSDLKAIKYEKLKLINLTNLEHYIEALENQLKLAKAIHTIKLELSSNINK